jgi:colanic acid/amylovoran biosynthesis glycosyltransferase
MSALVQLPVSPPEPSPLRVAHAVSQWLPQTCTWLHTQLRHLPAEIESHVICESTLNLDQFPIPHIHSLRRDPLRFLWDRSARRLHARPHLPSLLRRAERIGAPLLHSHFGNVGWAYARPARELGLKHVVTFYGWDVNYLPRSDPRWLDRYPEMFDQVDLVLCEGAFMAHAVRRLGCPPQKLRVHPLGVDLSRIPFRPRTYRPGEPLRVFIGAAFREKKGIPTALDALGRIREKVPLEVTIAGDAPADRRGRIEKERIRNAVARHGLERRVRFVGALSHEAFLATALDHHVYLAPSQTARDGDTEGGAPVSLIELAASGMPVVSTNHCDIPDVVASGVSGLLAAERDPEGLARHLRFLAANPAAWPGMVHAARKRVETAFNARIQGELLAEVYRHLAR